MAQVREGIFYAKKFPFKIENKLQFKVKKVKTGLKQLLEKLEDQ